MASVKESEYPPNQTCDQSGDLWRLGTWVHSPEGLVFFMAVVQKNFWTYCDAPVQEDWQFTATVFPHYIKHTHTHIKLKQIGNLKMIYLFKVKYHLILIRHTKGKKKGLEHKKKKKDDYLWYILSDDGELQSLRFLKWMACPSCSLRFHFFPLKCLICTHLSYIILLNSCLTFCKFHSLIFLMWSNPFWFNALSWISLFFSFLSLDS